jgi:hypothetical protein
MFSVLVDRLAVRCELLDSHVLHQLEYAMPRSQPKVNVARTMTQRLKFQDINEKVFELTSHIKRHDIPLDTPWMYQCPTVVEYNPARVAVGSNKAQLLRSGAKSMVILLSLEDQHIKDVRNKLCQCAELLCRVVHVMNLPRFLAIKDKIPSMNEPKTCFKLRRHFKCPEAFQVRERYDKKRNPYLKSKWCDPSPVADLMERIRNDKLLSPLPDITRMVKMLRCTATRRLGTTLDAKSAFEQKYIVLKCVEHSAIPTLDGDTSVVNHITPRRPFSSYVGRVMDLYPQDDEIAIYSDNLDDYMNRVKNVLNILRQEGLYLNQSIFMQSALRLLGRVIDNQAFGTYPDEVDCFVCWKLPTDWDLLQKFISPEGYLIDYITDVHILMASLSSLVSCMAQPAFEEVKNLYHGTKEHCRVPLNYSKDGVARTPVKMTMEGVTGFSGAIIQRKERRRANKSALSSVNLNTARAAGYAMPEIEILVCVGTVTILSYTGILLGTRISWLSDHNWNGLIHLLNQKKNHGRQAQWLKEISSRITYMKSQRSESVVDTLSSCSDYSPEKELARAEIVYHSVVYVDTDVANGGTVDTSVSGASDLAMIRWMLADIEANSEAQVASGKSTGMRCLTRRMLWNWSDIKESSFVPGCPAAPAERKEDGYTSQINYYLSNTKDGDRCKVVTAESRAKP